MNAGPRQLRKVGIGTRSWPIRIPDLLWHHPPIAARTICTASPWLSQALMSAFLLCKAGLGIYLWASHFLSLKLDEVLTLSCLSFPMHKMRLSCRLPLLLPVSDWSCLSWKHHGWYQWGSLLLSIPMWAPASKARSCSWTRLLLLVPVLSLLSIHAEKQRSDLGLGASPLRSPFI